MKIPFYKFDGAGNDFVVIDNRDGSIRLGEEEIARLCHRRFGVGADGLVLIGRSRVADFSMRMYNADGSEGLMCGNAARCIGRYVYEKGLTDKRIIELETASGVRRLQVHLGCDGKVESVSVGMGSYRILQRELTLEAAGRSFTGMYVDVGNPHFVVFVPDVMAVDVRTYGPLLEKQVQGGVNVEFASVSRDSRIRMRVWERGSGITLACGTGACATAAAAFEHGLCQSPCHVLMDGGALEISVLDGAIHQRGPAVTVFEGRIEA